MWHRVEIRLPDGSGLTPTLTLVANSRLLATIPKIRRPPREEFGPDSASCEFATTVNLDSNAGKLSPAPFVHCRPLAQVLDYRMGANGGVSAGIALPRAAQPVLRRSSRIPYGRSPVVLVAVWTGVSRSRCEPTRNHIQAGADRS